MSLYIDIIFNSKYARVCVCVCVAFCQERLVCVCVSLFNINTRIIYE